MATRPTTIERLGTRIEELKQQILDLDLVVAGTLVRRTKESLQLGKSTVSPPRPRHGPYFEWGRIEGGRRVSTTVSPAKARRLKVALRNQRRLKSHPLVRLPISLCVFDAEIAASHEQGAR